MAVYVVLGARGGTGREIVKRLAALPGADISEIRAVVRDPAKVEAGSMPDSERVKLLAGDCTEPESLREVFTGASGVFFAASGKGFEGAQAVDQNGVQSVAKLAKELNAGRVVLVSSQLTHPSNKFHPIRGILNTIETGLFHRRGFMDFKFEGEQGLRHSGQDYCIVRPGQLADVHRGQTEASGRAVIKVDQCNGSFLNGAAITRADLAAVCILAMTTPEAGKCTFEVGCDPAVKVGEPDVPEPNKELLAALNSEWDSAWPERLVDKKWTKAPIGSPAQVASSAPVDTPVPADSPAPEQQKGAAVEKEAAAEEKAAAESAAAEKKATEEKVSSDKAASDTPDRKVTAEIKTDVAKALDSALATGDLAQAAAKVAGEDEVVRSAADYQLPAGAEEKAAA